MTNEREERAKEEARKILDQFASALDKVPLKEEKTTKVQTSRGFREEGQGKKSDSGFRELMFKNAPNSDGKAIIAEKKSW